MTVDRPETRLIADGVSSEDAQLRWLRFMWNTSLQHRRGDLIIHAWIHAALGSVVAAAAEREGGAGLRPVSSIR